MGHSRDGHCDALGRSVASRIGRNDDTLRVRLCSLVVCVLFVTAVFMADCYAVQVVGNVSVPDQTLQRPAAWAMFSMRLRTWSDGSSARVFVLNDSALLHAEFTKKIFNTFPYQLRQAWDRLVFSGTGQAPQEVSSIDEMYDKILSTPGAIGYLPDYRVDQRVRLLKVE